MSCIGDGSKQPQLAGGGRRLEKVAAQCDLAVEAEAPRGEAKALLDQVGIVAASALTQTEAAFVVFATTRVADMTHDP